MYWFISRHPGALLWMHACGIRIDCHVSHLDLARIAAGDTVYGSLPVHLAAEVCARGARYYHLQLDLPAEARGCELSVDEMRQFGARLMPFRVERAG